MPFGIEFADLKIIKFQCVFWGIDHSGESVFFGVNIENRIIALQNKSWKIIVKSWAVVDQLHVNYTKDDVR